MKINKNIKEFRKIKVMDYSTSVTATKIEKIIIWICFILFLIFMSLAIFVFESIAAMIITFILGYIVLFSLMLFFIFRPLHKKERINNQYADKLNIDSNLNNDLEVETFKKDN